MKKYLCSFGDKTLAGGFSRLQKQAEQMGVFDGIYFYTQSDLDKNFKRKFRSKMVPYSRGFGFWCWKSQIILQTLDKIEDGDILLYIDIGSHLNVGGKKRLLEYFDIVNNSSTGILAFRSPTHLERTLTKMDIFEYFDVINDKSFTDTTQIEATHVFLTKNDRSISFVKEWNKVSHDDFSLITDGQSRLENFDDFKDNRHDQSILSILGKKYGITTLSTDETYSTNWDTMEDYPLLAKRDKVYKHKFQMKYQKQLGGIYRRLWPILFGK